MAYKSKGGCTPITAKIKRTTQGGMITQPLLDMGAPVKMKKSSPAKQTDTSTAEESFKNEMASQAETASKKAAALQAAKKKSDIDSYNKGLNQYRSDVSTLGKNKKTASASYNPYGGSGGNKTRVASQKNRIKDFEKNLYDYDTKNKPGSTEGYTAKEYAMAKASGTYKAKKAKSSETKSTTNQGTGGTTTTTKKGKKSYEQAYKDRDQKTYGKMTKAEYIKEAKRQNASKKAGKGWDVKGMGKSTTKKTETAKKTDATTKATTTNNKKSTNTKNSKGTEGKKYDLTNVTGSTGYQIKQKAKEIGGKISNAAKIAKAKKLTADAKRKTSKAAEKQSQAAAAIVAGKTSKADRKQRAADRKKSKAQKKGQAAKAIQPK